MTRTKLTIAGLVAGVTLLCGWARAGIEGSKHDFTNKEWSGGEICAACHSPHRAEAPTAAPLWNPGADLTRTFGATGAARKTRGTQPGNGTLICLRCHDGTIAAARVPDGKPRRPGNKQNPALFTTGHQTNNHPVGVAYPQGVKGFRPMTAVVAKGVALPAGQVECISCHDPHNQAGVGKMLVTSNARSRLCLTCHKK